MDKTTYDTHGKVIFWKNIFCPTKVTKSGEKEFLKLYIVLLRAKPRTPQDMDGRLKGVFSKLETSRNMKK